MGFWPETPSLAAWGAWGVVNKTNWAKKPTRHRKHRKNLLAIFFHSMQNNEKNANCEQKYFAYCTFCILRTSSLIFTLIKKALCQLFRIIQNVFCLFPSRVGCHMPIAILRKNGSSCCQSLGRHQRVGLSLPASLVNAFLIALGRGGGRGEAAHTGLLGNKRPATGTLAGAKMPPTPCLRHPPPQARPSQKEAQHTGSARDVVPPGAQRRRQPK